ncbi:major facilitator superfamily domain-containing protein [Fusarium phyllophilum]|uniref:Major facilitator superfamily domain-containing protein n=1 Tax=Fusarium phyllophilum TaxID=47803 RepID=A0A8H5MVE3_9HYPO|nr:major facilitator superfamily domain-containing protein [Fusarium phyllophilum]
MEKGDNHGKASNVEDAVSNSAGVLLYDDDGNVRNLPVPSCDPNDPLNFGMSHSLSGLHTFHPDRIADLASYPFLCMGLGNFFFVPLSMALGRRFAFILSNIVFVASIIRAAKSQSFESHLGARCLQGLTAGISDCLLPIIVLDMSFLYKRSARLIAYWAFTAIGSSILLIPIPFIIENAGGNWRLNYRFSLAFAVFAMILIIFCVPETLFNRRAAELSGRIHATDAYGTHRTFASPQAARDAGFDIEDAQSENPTELSYKRQFALFTVQPSPVSRFFRAYKDIFLCILVPGTLWVLLFNSMVFGGLVVLSLTYAQRLEMPPWNFSPETVGTVQIGAAIGALFGLGYGELAEPISRYLTKRNGGVREPEHVLPNFILPAIFCFLGMIIYGVVAADPTKYSWVGMHAAFALFYFGFCAISAVTGVWLGELLPHMSGPAIVLTCGGRNAISLGYSHSFNSWISAMGSRDTYILFGGILFALGSLAVPLYFFNGRIRRVMEKVPFLGTC